MHGQQLLERMALAALDATPELVNSDPYGEGWMVDVECATAEDADAAWASLLTAAQYADGLS